MKIKTIVMDSAIRITRNSVIRNILKIPYNLYLKYKRTKSLKNFQRYGFEALCQFNECMTKNGFRYSLAFGTMLGAIREKDFIPFDDDIDLAMWIDDYNPQMIACLKSYGITLVHSFSIDNDKLGKEDTFEYKGVQIDVFYFYQDTTGLPYCCDFICFPGCHPRTVSVKKHGGLLPRKLSLPMARDVITFPFRDIHVNIPSNYKELLEFRYGPDYMTPKPGWRPKTKYIQEMDGLIGTYTEYH